MHSDRARTYIYSLAIIVVASAGSGAPALADQAAEITIAGLSRWLDAYGEAWRLRDADKAADLFSEDSSYHVTPFETPHFGPNGVHKYWADVTANQGNIQFEYQPLSIIGNRGIAHWSAQFDIAPEGPQIELDGIFVLDFDENGKCRQLREWWHLRGSDAADLE